MLYSVSEASETIGLSKQTIYNKLKLKDLQGHIVKKQGITYIDDIGLKLIQDSLKLNDNGLNINSGNLKAKNTQDNINTSNDDIAIDSEDLSVKTEYINYLKLENERLWNELEQKNKQILNTQVILREQQKPQEQDIKQLEQHFRDLDNKLIEVREQMQQRKNKKSIFNIFKNKKE